MAELDDAPVFFVQCMECDEGEVWKGRWGGDWMSPPEDIFELCPVCLGMGFVVTDDPAHQITLEDLQREDQYA